MNKYARFMGVAFQMGAVIGGFTWLGVRCDQWFSWEPWGTVVFSLLGVILSMAMVIREVNSNK